MTDVGQKLVTNLPKALYSWPSLAAYGILLVSLTALGWRLRQLEKQSRSSTLLNADEKRLWLKQKNRNICLQALILLALSLFVVGLTAVLMPLPEIYHVALRSGEQSGATFDRLKLTAKTVYDEERDEYRVDLEVGGSTNAKYSGYVGSQFTIGDSLIRVIAADSERIRLEISRAPH